MNTGLGVRPELFAPIFDQSPALGFLEAHSENYFGASLARSKLTNLRKDYSVSLHGVGLSLGRADDLNQQHLLELKTLVNEIEPILVSEHLAWSAYSHTHLPDLLPLPLNESSLGIICAHIDEMQENLQRQILLENPSNYLLFDQLQIPEPEFLNTIAKRTGCGLLVDINNVYVSSINLERNAEAYLAQINSKFIGQYHLAGHTKLESHGEPLLIDTHNQQIHTDVWQLYEFAIGRHGDHPTLIEWDSDFPDFSILLDECRHADAVRSSTKQTSDVDIKKQCLTGPDIQPVASPSLAEMQTEFLQSILFRKPKLDMAVEPHRQRLWVYQNNVYSATQEYLEEVYPAVRGVVGEPFFKQMARELIKTSPPVAGNIYLYGINFSDILGRFDGLDELPYLEDLIRYEWALHEVYFSPVSKHSDDLIDLSLVSQAELLNLAVVYNPSVRLLTTDYPIYEIYRQSLPNYSGEIGINLQQSQDDLLVCKRPGAGSNQVLTKVLTNEQAVFLTKLSEKENIQAAIDACQSLFTAESISKALALVFELGLLSRNNY